MNVRRKYVLSVVSSVLEKYPDAITETGATNPSIIASALDIDVELFSLEESLSGFLLNENGRFLIGVNEKDGSKRQRFTIAHELGHYFLHDRRESYIDTKTGHVKITPRDEVSSGGIDPKEIEANLFAAELLMPEDRIRQDIEGLGGFGLFEETDKEISRLADRYDVSLKAFTIRLERLGYLKEV